MPSVCDCPFCGQPAAIPEDLDPQAAVQCPHCEYEFPADRALMYAVEAPPEHVAELPPTLVPVSPFQDVPLAQEPVVGDGQVAAAETGGDGHSPAAAMMEEVGEASSPDAVGDHREPREEPPRAAQTQAEEPANASEFMQSVPKELGVILEPTEAENESSPDEALAPLESTADSSPVSEAPAAGQAEAVTPAESLAPESVESTSVAFVSAEKAPEATLGEPSSDRPSPAWRERRKRNPVRTIVGVVISGMLGLAVPYGAWLGLAKLGIVGRPRPLAAPKNHAPADAKSARPESAMVLPPQPTEWDEWPGLDENRFAVDPKETNKEEKPSRQGKKGKPAEKFR